jgi:hypothetical protein
LPYRVPQRPFWGTEAFAATARNAVTPTVRLEKAAISAVIDHRFANCRTDSHWITKLDYSKMAMMLFGFENVYALIGGWREWVNSDYPTEPK